MTNNDKPNDNSKEIEQIKNEIRKIEKDTKSLKSKLDTLEKMNNNEEIDFDIYLKESSKIQRKIKVNDSEIETNRLSISLFLNKNNKFNHSDLEDFESAENAKRIINEVFSGFIVSKGSNFAKGLYRNGASIDFEIRSTKIKKKNDDIEAINRFEAQIEFEQFLEDIKELYKKDQLDNSFSDLLKTINFKEFKKATFIKFDFPKG